MEEKTFKNIEAISIENYIKNDILVRIILIITIEMLSIFVNF